MGAPNYHDLGKLDFNMAIEYLDEHGSGDADCRELHASDNWITAWQCRPGLAYLGSVTCTEDTLPRLEPAGLQHDASLEEGNIID